MAPISRRRLLAASMAAPFTRLVTIPPAEVRGSEAGAVPTHRGNLARTGENPGPGPPAGSPVRWFVRLGERLTSSPVVVDGTIYIGSLAPDTIEGGALHAVDAATGIERWRLGTVPRDGFFSTPAVENGRVVVTSYDGIVLAASTETGEEHWRFQGAGPCLTQSPAISGNTVFTSTFAGHFYAIDAETGEERWRYAASRPAERYFSTPAYADDVIYFMEVSIWDQDPSYLHAFDADTGEERWRFEPTSGIHLILAPIVTGGIVYVLTFEGGAYTLDAGTGETRSEFDLGVVSASAPALVGDMLYVGTEDGQLAAFSMTTGERAWNVVLQEGTWISSAPTVAGNHIYAGDSSGRLHAIDRATGTKRWDRLSRSLYSVPAIIDGVLYVGNIDGSLLAVGGAQIERPVREHALDESNAGELRYLHQPEAVFLSSPGGAPAASRGVRPFGRLAGRGASPRW